MWGIIKKLLNSVDRDEQYVPHFNRLPMPSKRALKKRDERVAKCIEEMKANGTYLNVSFKKEQDPAIKLEIVPKTRKTG